MSSRSYERLTRTIASRLRDLQDEIRRQTTIVDTFDFGMEDDSQSLKAGRVTAGSVHHPRLQMDVRKARELRLLRKGIFAKDKVSGAGWDILLHLFESRLLQLANTVGNVCDGAEIPSATAVRWMTRLEDDGLIALTDDRFDGRRRLVELTELGVQKMEHYFSGPSRLSIAA